MAETARAFPAFIRRQETEEERERRILLSELSRTRSAVQQAYVSFNSVKDPELVESFVFEINALQARYAYLLRRVKELGVSAPPAGIAPCRETESEALP